MKTILYIAIIILLAGVALAAFAIAAGEKRARKDAEKKADEVRKNAEKKEAINAETAAIKADAVGPNNSVNLDYIANKLHDYANKSE